MNKLDNFKDSWKTCIKDKNLSALMNLYDNKCLFKGTFSKNPTKEYKNIENYFIRLFKNISGVRFLSNTITFERNNLIISCGNYNFYSGKKIIKAQYQFILEKKNNNLKLISHISNLID